MKLDGTKLKAMQKPRPIPLEDPRDGPALPAEPVDFLDTVPLVYDRDTETETGDA